MKVSILSPDLSRNCLGRAYLLAKLLQRHYEVEIVGPIFGDGIWQPVADDDSITYESVKVCGRFEHYRLLRELTRRITGDVIYASKPLFWSFHVGLLKKLLSKKPLVLDIDDWELGFVLADQQKLCSGRSTFGRVRTFAHCLKTSLRHPLKFYFYVSSEKLVNFADQLAVSNSFLQSRFGGTIVWHARDTMCFDPNRFDKNSARQQYGLATRDKIVLFCGTPHPHKGIEDLIMALKPIPEVLLVIVGIDERKYCQELVFKAKRELGNERIRTFGPQPFSKLPLILAMSDIIVIPQSRSYATIGQVPAKVFDAMAMAKPIIATNVSDLPEILSDCGWIVEPDEPDDLARAIRYVLDHPEEAEEKGQKARECCKARYSYDAMEETLLELFKKYE